MNLSLDELNLISIAQRELYSNISESNEIKKDLSKPSIAFGKIFFLSCTI